LPQIETGLIEPSPDYVIGFHRSFATSQDHLHLHAFEKPFKTRYKRWISYNPSFIFFASIEEIKRNVEKKIAKAHKVKP
jgi:hypothetical protein